MPYHSIKLDAHSLRVTVAIVRSGSTQGSLEDVCLQAFATEPVMPCVDTFFNCLSAANLLPAEKDRAKARLAAYFAARLDEKEVRGIGLAVKQSWWNWEHPAFDTLKQFMRDVAQDVT